MKSFQQIAEQYQLQANSPLSVHANAIIREFYHAPYKNADPQAAESKITRPIHGGQHTSRVALNVEVFTKMYRRYGDSRALLLEDEDLIYIQIAALFHDAAREDDGEDRWDNDSAALCFHYLITVMGLKPEKAKIYAEAIANKDYKFGGKYHHLRFDATTQTVSWNTVEHSLQPKSIEASIIQNADCLDVIRCYDTNYRTFKEEKNMFDGTRLDFYKDVAQDNDKALYELGNIVNEARAMIHRQGDGHGLEDESIKIQFEHAENCFDKTKEDASLGRIYKQLCTQRVKSIYDERAVDLLLSEIGSAQRDFEMGNLFLRGIYHPTAKVLKEKDEKFHETDETFAELECRKFLRNETKVGNPLRSVTQSGYGSIAFSPAGYLIKNVPSQIQQVYQSDAGTGYGKKQHLKDQQEKVSANEMQLSLYAIHKKNMLQAKCSFGNKMTTHSEILYHMTKADAIYFSLEKTHNDLMDDHDLFDLNNRITGQLQALYIQQMHFVKTDGELLPIYSFDPICSVIQKTDICFKDTEALVKLWEELIASYIEKNKFTDGSLFDHPLNTLKILACYGREKHQYWNTRRKTTLVSIDSFYNESTQKIIDKAIQRVIEEKRRQFYVEVEGKLSKSDFIDDSNFLFITYHNKELTQKFLHKFINKKQPFLDNSFATLYDLGKDVFRGMSVSVNTLVRLDNQDFSASTIHVFYQSSLVTYFLICKKLGENDRVSEVKNKIRGLLENGVWDNQETDISEIVSILKTFDLYSEYEEKVHAWLLALQLNLNKGKGFSKARTLLQMAVAIKMDVQVILKQVQPFLTEVIENVKSLSFDDDKQYDSCLVFALIENVFALVGQNPCKTLDDLILRVCQLTFPIDMYKLQNEFFAVLEARHLTQDRAIFMALLQNLHTIYGFNDLSAQIYTFMKNVKALKERMPTFALKDYPEIIIAQFNKLREHNREKSYGPKLFVVLEQIDCYRRMGALLDMQNDPLYLKQEQALCEEINEGLAELKRENEKIELPKDIKILEELGTRINQSLFEELANTKNLASPRKKMQ